MGLRGKLLFAPFASYFMLMLYAAIMSTFLGHQWMKDNKTLGTEYVVILQTYCMLCLFGHTLNNRKNSVD